MTITKTLFTSKTFEDGLKIGIIFFSFSLNKKIIKTIGLLLWNE